MDDDTIAIDNLHRQVIHDENNVGGGKAESVANAVKRFVDRFHGTYNGVVGGRMETLVVDACCIRNLKKKSNCIRFFMLKSEILKTTGFI